MYRIAREKMFGRQPEFHDISDSFSSDEEIRNEEGR